MKLKRPSSISTDDHSNNHFLFNKRTKHFQTTLLNQPLFRRDGEEQDREDYDSSSPSSSQSSPLQPGTPDNNNSQVGHPCCLNGNHPWPLLTSLDEIELLSVIEKNAETYSNDEIENHAFLLSICPAFQSDPKLSTFIHSTHQQPIVPPVILSDAPFIHQPPPRCNSFQDHKPFKCSLCPKTFTRNYDLTRHKSSHQDQRQHVCTTCGRSFNRRDALTRHSFVRGCGTTT